jgi:cation diffusion facilitator CzcD-associated flavoprotein CzcO
MTSDRLQQLSLQVRADLDAIRHPADPWVIPRTHSTGARVHDVVIVGGGQSGLAIAFALMRDRVDNILVLDRRPAGLEGPWKTTARMRTLRTAKHLPGIELGLPSLTPRAWYVARYGEEAWERLNKIPKEDWQDYLIWCRETLGIPVRNLAEVTAILPERSLFSIEVTARDDGGRSLGSEHVYARHIVLATGAEGSGTWQVPPFVAQALPRDRYAHAGEDIDFDALRGKRVAVLGAGASAFDNASTALEAGATSAVLCMRRREVQRVNPQMWMGKAGFLRHFPDLEDAWKWRFMRHMFALNIPAPQDAYDRFSRQSGASLRLGAGWRAVRMKGGAVEVDLADGETLEADFLIVAIGFDTDLRSRPELAAFADEIALWRDRFTPPPGEEDSPAAGYPYLGPSFEFTEKRPGAAPYLGRIRNFTYGTFVSMGLSGAALSGLKFSVQRLAEGITRALFLEDAAEFHHGFTTYAEPEMNGAAPFDNLGPQGGQGGGQQSG